MKLGVDARMMYGVWQYRGIGRYIKSIIEQLPNDNVVAFLPEKQTVEAYKTISKGISIFPWWEQMVLPGIAPKADIDYLLCPSITAPVQKIKNVKKIVVIYDLIFMQSFSDLPPSHSLYNNLGRLYRRFLAPKGYKTADLLISISEYSKNELCEKFNIPKQKIHVIPCSISASWYMTEIIPANDRLKYLITVTGDAPSKNLHRLINAFAQIVSNDKFRDFKLRIVGVAKKSRPHYMQIINQLNLQKNIVFENFLDDKQLQELYKSAWASLTLSLYEGFGIPIVEAMASGTPVVCSTTTSMPEVAGEHAIYADPRNLQSMVDAISKILSASDKERDELSNRGKKWAERFSEPIVSKKISDFWSKIK